ncbi:EpsG family protein [Butyrivibrio sp. INlla21]|uniref:EpsG family protein n=1 Tax=Butyrivibrio sp. INlla21 TaxID=1520811 RepID=UPI0015A584CD|nr:EpsG family protein [Butyrivibrio sp. INlla21]
MLPFVGMAFVGGFRYNVGVDYPAYEWIYDYVNESPDNNDYIEVGFRVLMRFVNEKGGTVQLVFLIASVLTAFFYYHFIKDNSVNFELSTMLYLCLGPFYFSSFNGVRQALAISIVLYATKYCGKDNVKYIILVLFATTIHTSSILMLLLMFSTKLKENYLLYALGTYIVGAIATNSNIVNMILNRSSSYSKYIDHPGNYWDKSYLLFAAIIIFAFLFRPIWKRFDKKYMCLLAIVLALIAVGYGHEQYSMLMTRFIMWGSPIFIILIPQMVSMFKQKKELGVIICFVSILYYFNVARNGANMYPYMFNFKLLQ